MHSLIINTQAESDSTQSVVGSYNNDFNTVAMDYIMHTHTYTHIMDICSQNACLLHTTGCFLIMIKHHACRICFLIKIIDDHCTPGYFSSQIIINDQDVPG